MSSLQKEEQISFIKDLVQKSECLILAGVEGLNATQVAELRRNLHKEKIGFKVIKNKLAKIAIKDTDACVLDNDFAGSTAIAWSESDPVTPAKILVKFEKEFEKLQLKSGFNSSKRLNFEQIKALSALPNLDELRAQMLGLFNTPLAKLLAQINAPASNMVGVLSAKIDKEKDSE